MKLIHTLVLSYLLFLWVFVQAENRQCTDKVPIKDWTFALQTWCQRTDDPIQIHGLWPNPDCKECFRNPFDIKQLKPETLSLMERYWNACGGQTNEDLWKHEWEKHGCGSGLTMDNYFLTAVKVYNEIKYECNFKGYKDCKITLSNEEMQNFLPSDPPPDDNNEGSGLWTFRDELGWLFIKFLMLLLIVIFIRSTTQERSGRTDNGDLEMSLIDPAENHNQNDQREHKSKDKGETEPRAEVEA